MRVTRASRTMPTEKQYLYYLIVSQLYNDGHTEAAIQLEMTALQSTGCVKAGDRLDKMLSACVGGFTDVTNFLDEQKAATHTALQKTYTTPPPSSSRKRPLPSTDPISSTSVASDILHANTDPNTSPSINDYKCVKLVTNNDLNTIMLSPTTPETTSSEVITETSPPEIPIQEINTDTQIGLNDPKEYPKINITNPLTSPILPILDSEIIQNIDTTNTISNFSNLTKDLEDICKAVADELPLPVNYAELIKPASEETTVKDEAEVSIKTEQIDPPDLEDSNATLNNLTACIMGSLAQYQDTPGPSVDYTNYIENQKSGMDMLMGYKDGSPISSSSPASLNTTDVMVPVSGEHSTSEATLSSDAPTKKPATNESSTSKPPSKPTPRTSKNIPFKLKLECVKYGLDNGSDWSKTAQLFNKRYPKFIFKSEAVIQWSEKVKVHLKKLRDKEFFSKNTGDVPKPSEKTAKDNTSSSSRKGDSLNSGKGDSLDSGKGDSSSSGGKGGLDSGRGDNLSSGKGGFDSWDQGVRNVVNTPSGRKTPRRAKVGSKKVVRPVVELTCPVGDKPLTIAETENIESYNSLTIQSNEDIDSVIEGSVAAVNVQSAGLIQNLPTPPLSQGKVILCSPLDPGVVPIVCPLDLAEEVSSNNITRSYLLKNRENTSLNIPSEKKLKEHVQKFQFNRIVCDKIKKKKKTEKTKKEKTDKKKEPSEKSQKKKRRIKDTRVASTQPVPSE